MILTMRGESNPDYGKGEVDELGPGLVVAGWRLYILSRTRSRSARSMTNAMRVNDAAKTETRDAIRVTVIWVESARKSVTVAAIRQNSVYQINKKRRRDHG